MLEVNLFFFSFCHDEILRRFTTGHKKQNLTKKLHFLNKTVT